MSTLTLALKGEYFDEIKAGRKLEEYRLITPYWQKRLEGRVYQIVELTRGYPRSDDESKRLRLPWRGFRLATITHPHFGPDPVEVFAIDVSTPVKPAADWSSAPADATHVIRRPGCERVSWVRIANAREAYWRWSTQRNWFISSDSPEKLLAHPDIEPRPVCPAYFGGLDR